MKILELFAGTGTISKHFRRRGHQTFTVDFNTELKGIDLYADIGKIQANDILQLFGKPDVIWASPDCTTYSVAGIGIHRMRGGTDN